MCNFLKSGYMSCNKCFVIFVGQNLETVPYVLFLLFPDNNMTGGLKFYIRLGTLVITFRDILPWSQDQINSVWTHT